MHRPRSFSASLSIARASLGIAEGHLEPYGHYKAKVSLKYLDTLKDKKDGKLILVTAINHFSHDTQAELALLQRKMAHHSVPIVLARHWAEDGKGAEELARTVVKLIETMPPDFRFVYEDNATLWNKVKEVATKIYGAREVTADSKVRAQIKKLQEDGYGHYPVCIAKTQYSFSTDPQLRGAPSGHVMNIREVRLAAGAEFIVMICGDIMTMPGLPKIPSAEKIDVVDSKVVGLF